MFIAQPKHFNFKGQPFSGRLPLASSTCLLPAPPYLLLPVLPLPGHVYVPMMTIAFLFLAAASISVWASASAFALPLARFLPRFFFHCCFFLFFVLHVVVGFSPLVYNFNKILLTNSGNGRQRRRWRWRRWQGSIRQDFLSFMPIFIPSPADCRLSTGECRIDIIITITVEQWQQQL